VGWWLGWHVAGGTLREWAFNP